MEMQLTYQQVSDKAMAYLRVVGYRQTDLDPLLNDFFENREAWEKSQGGLERIYREIDSQLRARRKLSDACFGPGGLIAHLKTFEDDVSSLRRSGETVMIEQYARSTYPRLLQKIRTAMFDDGGELSIENLALLKHLGYDAGFEAKSRKLTVVTRVGRLTLCH